MSIFTRRRVLVAGLVAAFLVAFAVLGALSKSSGTAEQVVAGPVPQAEWYWSMAISPSDPEVLVLGTSSGLYRSTDGGATWNPTGPTGINATSVVGLGSSIFAGGARMAGPGSALVWKGPARTAADGATVLVASADGGETWRQLELLGLPNATVQALVVDPADDESLYALLNNGRLFRSTDGGRSFRLVSELGVPPWALAIADGKRLLAGNMDTGHQVRDDGAEWRQTDYKDMLGDTHVMEFAVKPGEATRVIMTSRGIELSTDAGRTWRLVLRSNEMFGPVAWDPSDPDTAYAVGFDRTLWRTDDGGETWTKLTADETEQSPT